MLISIYTYTKDKDYYYIYYQTHIITASSTLISSILWVYHFKDNKKACEKLISQASLLTSWLYSII